MLRKIAFWFFASPFVVVLIVAIGLLAIAIGGIYFCMKLLGAPEAEWSA